MAAVEVAASAASDDRDESGLWGDDYEEKWYEDRGVHGATLLGEEEVADGYEGEWGDASESEAYDAAWQATHTPNKKQKERKKERKRRRVWIFYYQSIMLRRTAGWFSCFYSCLQEKLREAEELRSRKRREGSGFEV